MREVSLKTTMLLTFIFVCALFSCERRSLGSGHTFKQTKALKHEVSMLSDSVMTSTQISQEISSTHGDEYFAFILFPFIRTHKGLRVKF